MATLLNVGRLDRALRVVVGVGLGSAGILVRGHPYLGWALGIAGYALPQTSAVGGWRGCAPA